MIDQEMSSAEARRLRAGEVLFAQGENDRDRLKLGEDDDACVAARVDDVSLVHEANAGAPGNGRDDAGVVELHFRALDGRGVGLHGGGVRCVGPLARREWHGQRSGGAHPACPEPQEKRPVCCHQLRGAA